MFPPLVLWLSWVMVIECEFNCLLKLGARTPPSSVFPHCLWENLREISSNCMFLWYPVISQDASIFMIMIMLIMLINYCSEDLLWSRHCATCLTHFITFDPHNSGRWIRLCHFTEDIRYHSLMSNGRRISLWPQIFGGYGARRDYLYIQEVSEGIPYFLNPFAFI